MSTPRPAVPFARAPERILRRPSQIPYLPRTRARALDVVAARYAFRAGESYLSLIDWDDPDDPIRRLVVPDIGELRSGGALDASDEAANTVVRGVQHKYADTALVLAADTCTG